MLSRCRLCSGLRSIPTVYLFQNGQPVDGLEGPQTGISHPCCWMCCPAKRSSKLSRRWR